MKVWQFSSHLMDERGAKVDDWTWRQTRRRLGVLARLAKPYRARTALAIVTLVAYTAVALLPPYLSKLAVDDGIADRDLETLTLVVVAFLVTGVAAFVLSGAQTYFTGWVGERGLADLRIRLFDHLQRLSLGYYERNRTGATVSRITNDVEALDQLVTDGLSSLVQNTLVLAGTVIVLFLLDWRLALATLIVLPLMGLATAWFRSRSNHAYRRVRERLGLVTATLAEDRSGMRVVQSFTREPTSQTTFRGVNERYRESNYETVILNGLYFPAVDILSSVATAIVLGVGGWLVVEGEMTVGTLLAFSLYLANFFDPVQQLSQLYNTFLSATAALDRITVVLDEEPEIVDTAEARDLTRIEGHVHFEHVRFGYGELPDVLHDFDLDVPAGTTVALVGHTGAGKSTIAKLLARFYDPREGRITIDGTDLRTVTQESLRRQLGIVPQEGFLFAGSIADNIAFGRPSASRAEIVQAAEAVGADVFVTDLPEGYDTEVGERGFKLSLGQRQLVAFARALLADPRILILDEATSSVDIGTERRIERGLRRLLTGRTAFIIAHRLSTIRRADLIVVLDHGRIVDAGTHDELVERVGPYRELYGDWAAEVA
jgi:ABC-type multidrug transport system fused ATPase/permease subunit